MIIYSPPLPYKTQMGTGLTVGTKINVSGRVLATVNSHSSFTVNLCAGWDGRIKSFHFNPRFAPYDCVEPGKNKVVCNTRNGDFGWGYEVRPARFPFEIGKCFMIEIRCEHGYFDVFVDGKMCVTYKYRLPLEDIDVLEISGELDIFTIEVKGK
ncbi:unnamed protein product [Orchesella dallaii]|uniref:Galectin n=1 Tax=Orchesella dallaii TaxID=48710 RepID=A0ABP1S694_9HEXA